MCNVILSFFPSSFDYASMTTRIWLDDVSCHPNDSTLLACGHRRFGVHNCVHLEDVALVCSGSNATISTVRSTFVACPFISCLIKSARLNSVEEREESKCPPPKCIPDCMQDQDHLVSTCLPVYLLVYSHFACLLIYFCCCRYERDCGWCDGVLPVSPVLYCSRDCGMCVPWHEKEEGKG